MNGKSVGLIIVWWIEAIISLRVLLFSIPVMINKYLAKSFALSDLNNRFIAVLTVTALIFFGVGIVSILGFKNWKALHYLAAIIALLLTVGSLYMMNQPLGTVDTYYFYPILFANLVVLLIVILGRATKTA